MTHYLLSVHGPVERSEFGDYGSREEMEAAFAATGAFHERLKEQVLFSVSQREAFDGTRWLLDKARDESQPMEVRRKAVFWAGQGHASVADISALYKSTKEERLREHVIFVLSQRDEEAATNQLISIAREDPDREMRKKALFWLAQKDDPRVTKLITDLVIH